MSDSSPQHTFRTCCPVYTVVGRCLHGGLGESVSKIICRTLTDHAVRRDAIDGMSPLPGVIRAEFGVSHHRTVRISHYSLSSFPSVSRSWICYSTAFSFSGTGSPRCAAFSVSDTPSLEM